MSEDVAELERALAELRARYRTMVEDAPEAIVVFDRDQGRFVEVNAAACRLYGMDREALLRTGPIELSPERQPDGRPSREASRRHIEAALGGDKPVFEWIHRDAHGRLVPCRVQLARVEVAGQHLVRGSLQDLSELLASARAHARLHRVLEATTDLVSVGAPDGRVLWINRAGRRMLGLGPDDDVTDLDFAALHPEASARRLREEAVPHALRHGAWTGETELQTRDGTLIPVSQVVIAHTEPDGRIDSLSTIARDVSEQKALERHVLQAQKIESLGVMAGGVAHDFNNLLLGILGNASLLRDDLETGSEAHHAADQILRIGERASHLARQLLAYAGRTEVTPEAVDLSEVARDSADLVAASVSRKVRVRFELAEGLSPVEGDPTQLRQVLMNLVLNAAEAIGDANGEITIATAHERLDPGTLLHSNFEAPAEAGERVPCVVCEVRDTGAGIPPGMLERIFDPFYTTKAAGRGLGLSALLGIVLGHRGGLAVTSPPGGGTAFRLALPAREGARRVEAAAEESPRRWRGEGTVLLADDEASVRHVCRRALERLGFEVVEAGDGLRAVERLEAEPDRFVVAVVDLTMPGLDGLQVLARVRALRPDLPVVLASGYAAGRAEGADAFLPKPFTPARLAAVLESLLAPRPGGATGAATA